MATLIAVYNSEGCAGRCDARCYNAEHGECQCICGGRNHGAGEQRALENTRELAEKWVKRYEDQCGVKLDLVECLGGLFTPDAVAVSTQWPTVTDPRRLTPRQYRALAEATEGRLSVSRRTIKSLQRRGLLDEASQITPVGEALMATL